MDGTTKETAPPHVVIVGGGFGGLTAAKLLRNAPVQVTMIDRTNHHVFQPLLYQVATAGLSAADIAAPIRSVVGRPSNVEVLMDEVTGVDTQGRRVLMGGRSVAYDYLVLATGANYNYFSHPEWEAVAPSLKTLADAMDIRRRILSAYEAAEQETDPDRRRALMTFVLVGAGPTGVELAGAIAELAHRALARDFHSIQPKTSRILLLEAAPRILGAFPEDLAQKAQAKLEQMGVDVRTGAKVESVDEDGVFVAGERIPSKTIIWTAGVTASPAGRWLGAEIDRAGRVKVQPDLSVPGHPNVFVIGDTMTLTDRTGRPLPGVAQVAIQQGEYVASLIRRRVKGEPAPPPFHYRDKGNLATVGRSFAILDMHGFKLSGFLAWVLWLCIHIFFLIGFRNRLVVLTDWAWNYFTFQRGARVFTQAAPVVEGQASPVVEGQASPVVEGQASKERQDLAAMH
jgi:NADH dehydrogenase